MRGRMRLEQWTVRSGVRHVAAALLCAGTVACTAIFGLSDKPLVEPAADAATEAAVDAGPPQAILFGGYNQGDAQGDNAVILDDTWSFDGHSWTNLGLNSSPGARYGAAMTALAGRVFLFGGVDEDVKPDTWSFSGGTWKGLAEGSVVVPPPRIYAGLATLGANVVLFGGFQGGALNDSGTPISLNDTWVWNGMSWAQQKPTTVPPIRDGMAMATFNGKVVLFGGENSSPETPVGLSDTWEWDGTDWTALDPAHRPSARSHPGIALAPTQGHVQLILFGGFDDNGDPFDDTWTWDGTDWTELHPAGTPGARGASAMSSFNGGAILFGGLDDDGNDLSDTWLWDGTTWAGSSAMGPGARDSTAVVGL
jgi:hypothetical protein